MPESVIELLKMNKAWASQTTKEFPNFFTELAKGQSPNFLWIGCSDSRVPATQLTNQRPGDIFVQRNIANVVVPTDSNLLSVLFYAVKVLQVKHIIVCGHYGCGGVNAAMSNKNYGYIDNWLMHIKNVYRIHEKELDAIKDEEKRFDRFVELNVQEQVGNIAKMSMIQEEWEKGQFPHIHGLVYNLSDGVLKQTAETITSNKDLEKVYQYKIH